MAVRFATHPPLGSISVVQTRETNFTIVLEVPSSRGNEPWEAALWHSSSDAEWSETLATRIPEQDTKPMTLHREETTQSECLYFSSKLAIADTCSFTLKFRTGPDGTWRWARNETGIGDGTAIVQSYSVTTHGSPGGVADLVEHLNPRWAVGERSSQTPKTRLWSLRATTGSAQGDTSFKEEVALGLPWGGHFLRWFSLARASTPWIAPIQGKTQFMLSHDGVFCSFLGLDGNHLAVLAVSGLRNVMTSLRSDGGGNVVVRVRNDSNVDEQATILIAIGDDFDRAMAAVMYEARDMVRALQVEETKVGSELAAPDDQVAPQWSESWYDGLGYCTWNALGQRLSDQTIFDALDKLAAGNIRISNLIIDDNWQSIDYRGHGQAEHGWLDFEAEPEHFPKGLKTTVQQIREKHPHIQHVAVWHALFGYWGGISPDGKIAKDYRTVDAHRKYSLAPDHSPDGMIKVVSSDDARKLYDDFYKFLSSCGVDGVKTDAQFLVDAFTSAVSRKELTNAYLDAWSAASLRYFGTRTTSCMAQSPQLIFRQQLPHNRPRFPCRNSDDYFPGVPTSHAWHVWVNAHNSLLARHLNVLPDWDMFQTVHEYSAYHAAARCVSGGPIYITDVPGEHNLDLLGEMTARTARDRTVILRPSVVGKSIDPYAGYDDGVLLKVGAYHGASGTGTPIVGIFNISTRPVLELIPLSSFPGVTGMSEYIVTAHAGRTVTGPLKLGEGPALLTASLDERGYEIFTAYPLQNLGQGGGQVQLANLGLLRKMTGAAAVATSSFYVAANGRIVLDTNLKALGTLGVYISHLPSLTIDGDFIATMAGRVIPRHSVSVSEHDEHVLEIDAELAWEAVQVPVGWGNEVNVKVYFTAGG